MRTYFCGFGRFLGVCIVFGIGCVAARKVCGSWPSLKRQPSIQGHVFGAHHPL